VIVRVDGHCEVAPDYVRRCVTHLRDGADAVGGPLETIGQTPMASAIALAMSSTFGVGNAAFRTVSHRTMTVDTVAFPAYTRAVVDRLGRFDEELVRNQDDEYNYRLRRHGGVIRLASDIRSRYYSRGSLRSLWRQYFQYGYWKVRVLQKHPRQMCLRQFVPPVFVATLAILAVLAIWSAWARAAFLTVVALYAAASVLQALRLAWRAPSRLVRLPVVFGTVHVAYGSGFLTGLIAFRRRWGPSSPSPVESSP
jgi:succinoglycan biosynthesis protein ExoA